MLAIYTGIANLLYATTIKLYYGFTKVIHATMIVIVFNFFLEI